ncbi:MAG: FAD-binding oxidoreductase [Candidatus Saccharimonadales bacterium]
MILDPYTWYTATIITIVRESANAVSIELDCGRQSYEFAPGQHTVVRVDLPHHQTKVMRQYSFASAPSSKSIWLCIVQTPGGEVSTWLTHHARVGDTLEISQAFTGPLVQDMVRKKICLIAGGSGIAPLMSHLRERRLNHSPQTILLYSTRIDSRCFTRELTAQPEETIHVRLTDQSPRLTQADIRQYCADVDAVLLCGSRQFVDTLRTYLSKEYSKLPVHAEAFSLS